MKIIHFVSCVVAFGYAISAQAMQPLNDVSLSQVSGQDGIVIDSSFSEASVDRLYLEDGAGVGNAADQTMRVWTNGATLSGNDMGTMLKIDTGSNAGSTGLDLELTASLGTLRTETTQICMGAIAPGNAGANCGSSLGALTVQTASPFHAHLKTTNGLFNEDAPGTLSAGLENTNIFITQYDGSQFNQGIIKDFNFSFNGEGYIFVDPARGLVMETRDPGNALEMVRVADLNNPGKTLPGLNLELMYKSNVANPSDDPSPVYSTTGAAGVVRGGISGAVTDASLTFRGVNDSAGAIMGNSYSLGAGAGSAGSASVLGSRGLYLNFQGAFLRSGDNPVVLELAHAGNNAYGIGFGNLSPLLVRTDVSGSNPALNTGLAYLNSGDIYFNLINTQSLLLPENTVLNVTKVGGSFLTSAADYQHRIHNESSNPHAIGVAVRGMDFQAVARDSYFIVSNDVTNPADIPSSSGSWGIGLPFHNLHANVALYGLNIGGEERIGTAFALNTQGVSADGSKTTSILLIDGEPNPNDGGNPTNYYMGLRNIDMFMAGYGSLGFSNGAIGIQIDDFDLAVASQFAAGYLPGSKFRSGTNVYAPVNGFTNSNDVLFGINLKLAGNGNVNLVPAPASSTLAANSTRFAGELTLTDGAIQLVEPVDGTTLGLDNMTGKIGFDNYIRFQKDSVDFHAELALNPEQTSAGVVRFSNVNLYPDSNAAAQRLGEIAISGGNLVSNLNIKPF